MLIRVSDPELAGDLREHFRRSGFTAKPKGGGMLEVARPDAPEEAQERREVEIHLRVWLASHPEAYAEMVD
jgi:hypothetical protein